MTQSQSDKTQIDRLISDYIEGINNSKIDEIVPLFTSDGVLMGADAPTMAGTEQLTAFFKQAFSEIKLSGQLFVDEIVVSGDFAYARTHSQVTLTLLQNSMSKNEENRELFLLRRDQGEWRIARYMFNKVPDAK